MAEPLPPPNFLPGRRKCPTRIEGLDQILEGGLPVGRTTLITGGPGTGKSLFGLEFLIRNALAGEAGIFVSFEEQASALRDNAATLGWALTPLEQSGKLFLFEASVNPKAVVTGEFGLQAFLSILARKLKVMNAHLVVIDAIDLVLTLMNDPVHERNELLALQQWLTENDLTVLMTVKAQYTAEQTRQYQFLDYLVDCVICLDNRLIGQLSTRRLHVAKYRGSGFGSNEYPFVIAPPGITLLPISMLELSHQPLGAKFPSGVAGLDPLLGGGFRRASSILVTGCTGAGKTILSGTFAQAAGTRGEKVLYVSFEESAAALSSSMTSCGIDLSSAIAAGSVYLLTSMPESMGAEQHLVRILALLRALQPHFLILESASACQRMGTPQAAFEFLVRLINRCKEAGITILLTNQTSGFRQTHEISGIGISSIIDTILVLRLVEQGDEMRRQLLVMKARGSHHSPCYHHFLITDRGIVLDQECH
ncbi:MAG: circadian clock protein KaiC [Candidatus Accumulibacter sp. UW26]|jgi:circadian clock protein KaiC